MATAPERLLLATPRGYCAGVDRAVQTVERALEFYGAPVYVRKEIVHNKHVVEQLRARGAVFVDSETEVPEGATAVFSAHGVSPEVHANARDRRLNTIDATCPLVTKVHREAVKFDGDKPVSITGNLTVKGVTKPVTLTVTSFKHAPNMQKKDAIGADATGTVKRSDFNMGKAVPLVSDEVTLEIVIEAAAP